MNEILQSFALRPWQSNGQYIRYLSMPQLQRTIYCFQISMSQVRFITTCQGTRILRLFDKPFFLMWYQKLKTISFTVIIVIQIIQPTWCNSFTSLLLEVYVCLNMFRVSPRPISGAYNCTRSLWFYRWREAAGALLVVVW